MKTPYRPTDFREICVRCDELANASCLRCELPLCEEHGPAEGARCDDCENDYGERFAVGLLVALIVCSMVPGVVVPVVHSMWASLGASLALGMVTFGVWLAFCSRTRFLAEQGVARGASRAPRDVVVCEPCIASAKPYAGFAALVVCAAALVLPPMWHDLLVPIAGVAAAVLSDAVAIALVVWALRRTKRIAWRCVTRHRKAASPAEKTPVPASDDA